MGITGLLPFLDKASEFINISSLANRTVAIDSYCWLHRGAFAVGDKLAHGTKTDGHIEYCIKFVNMLLKYNIKPILVFDGRHLPAKAETEAKRREIRKNARERAAELMRQGNHTDANKFLRRCVDITHEMALQLIQRCRAMNVDCIVAPYEADAQLAYLNKVGLADYIITEDSDLTLFGCQQILFKLDLAGNCVLVNAEKFHLAMDCPINKFTMDKFRLMCILSGCDYIDSLPGIGLKKALNFVKTTEETDLMRALDKIPAYLNMRNLTITEEYKINVLKARATFLHMVVFDPRRRKQVRLNEIEEFGTNIEHCCNAGDILDDKTALNLAVGNLNPFTLQELDNWHPNKSNQVKLPTTMNRNGLKVSKHPSIWNRDYRWTTNGMSTTQPKLALVKKSPKPKPSKRFSEKFIESDDDETLPTESQNYDMILNQYVGSNAPLAKRFKDDIDSEDEPNGMASGQLPNEQITPNRNPFKKSDSCTDPLLSPTRISKENNSLVKTQSPVKLIDFGKLGKLSKFNRTNLPKQRVNSRFFDTTPEASNETAKSVGMKSPNLLESYAMPQKSALYFTKNNAGTSQSKNEDSTEATLQNGSMDDALNVESQHSILSKFKLVLEDEIVDNDRDPVGLPNSQETSDKTDNETNELPIVLSDDDGNVDCGGSMAGKESTNRNWLQSSQKPKTNTVQKKTTAQRKKTTTSNKVATKSSARQPRLSMFGFEKKSQIQL